MKCSTVKKSRQSAGPLKVRGPQRLLHVSATFFFLYIVNPALSAGDEDVQQEEDGVELQFPSVVLALRHAGLHVPDAS